MKRLTSFFLNLTNTPKHRILLLCAGSFGIATSAALLQTFQANAKQCQSFPKLIVHAKEKKPLDDVEDINKDPEILVRN
jgi:hypothetical protein